jgi:beta-glucosidase
VSPVAGGWEAPRRLGGFAKVALAAGGSEEVTVRIDPRLLALYDPEQHSFHITAGVYNITLGSSARDRGAQVSITLPERTLPAGANPAH